MNGFEVTDLWGLLGCFVSLSLMSVGGAIATVPEMHRYLVAQTHWLSESQFSASIALAQAAPGPNVLFVAVLGWNVGAASVPLGAPMAWALSAAAMGVSMVGIILPSTTLTYFAARWGHQNRERAPVRAFKQSMAPVVVALLISTGWLLTSSHGNVQEEPLLWLLTFSCALLVWKTRIHLLWLLAVGATLGALGLI
jgi:chromate transporter